MCDSEKYQGPLTNTAVLSKFQSMLNVIVCVMQIKCVIYSSCVVCDQM